MKQVLANIKNERLKVYVIWMTAFARDSHGAAATRAQELADDWIRHYWDAKNATGRGWMPTFDMPRPAWDVYFLYGAGATWADTPTYPDFLMHQLGGMLPEEYHFTQENVRKFEQKAKELVADSKNKF